MDTFLMIKKYSVLLATPDTFKPFNIIRGPITFEEIDFNNLRDVTDSFPEGKIDVFKKKLHTGNVGIFSRHSGSVVGYMWRKDYDEKKIIKADGYVPLSGRFSHIHFAMVSKRMRGRGLQLIMIGKLIEGALKRDIHRFYTDVELKNKVALKGILKVGFEQVFKLLALRFRTGHTFCFCYDKK